MGLNPARGNMYPFIDYTWNTVKGKCWHDCSYCYAKKYTLKSVRLAREELTTDLLSGKFLFIGSSCDMWAENIPDEWIDQTLDLCYEYDDNKYLFQTKNPARFRRILMPDLHLILCATLETNRYYPEIMRNSPKPQDRIDEMKIIAETGFDTHVTIEPVMDFDLDEMVSMIKTCSPKQVNIGADSCNTNLPEPSKEKLLQLIEKLEEFTVVHKKPNLGRLLNKF